MGEFTKSLVDVENELLERFPTYLQEAIFRDRMMLILLQEMARDRYAIELINSDISGIINSLKDLRSRIGADNGPKAYSKYYKRSVERQDPVASDGSDKEGDLDGSLREPGYMGSG